MTLEMGNGYVLGDKNNSWFIMKEKKQLFKFMVTLHANKL